MANFDLSPLERERKFLTRDLATDNAGNEILIELNTRSRAGISITRDTYAGGPGNITMTTAACDGALTSNIRPCIHKPIA